MPRRLGVAVLIVILIALGVWSAASRDDGASLQLEYAEPSGDVVRVSPAAESAPPLNDPAAAQSSGSAGSTAPEGRAEVSEARESTVGGPFFASEPVDPDWAPRMAATLDSVVRSLSGAAREVKVECGSSRCRAIVLHYPSLFTLDEEARNDVVIALMEGFGDAMRPDVVASLGLDDVQAIGLVELSPREALGSLPPEDAYGTVFVFTRASLPNASD